jgi:DNA repair ATPase RecN
MSEDLTRSLPSSDGEKLTQILATVNRLDSRLGSLEQKVDERLHDTRPIWEKVNADIAELQVGQQRLTEGQQRLEEGQVGLTERQQRFEEGQQRLTEGQQRLQEGQLGLTERQQRFEEGQQRLEEGQEFLRGESREIRTLLRDIFRRLSIFNDTLVTMQADYRDIYDRVRDIERQR